MARGHCSSVATSDCEAPAGFRTGTGVRTLPQQAGLLICAYCEEKVCAACAVTREAHTVCPDHTARDLKPFLALLSVT